ncbi:rhomboid family intramembrane serine protease [Ruania alkalisoli]|uniref:Rhomboid family intramembrane serine protease n=2 Tax=Ruania alkalisoli TaxID=2779775 RepID=A0A7M1STE9_9MICO|nr:rhomboid family intramembrane serine protease [Ruania alkalisoli]QOR70849.1 rhomboid family intramembrane serine protease [Ruania alkalisoli]
MTSYPAAPAPGGGGQAGPPVCPRHPDRVSYVTCQRCSRPTCPECQRPAAVGVHCVDCVREANRSVRPTRTVLGGRVSASDRPVVTMTIIGICVALFLASYVLPIMPFFRLDTTQVADEPWRMITSAFLHNGWLHLLLNMYALWIVGPFLENMLGRWRYVALYLVSALGGSVAVLLLTSGAYAVAGASGAVFGFFGAIAVVLRRTGRDARQILIVIAINVVFGFVVAGISWQAHLGGLVVGTALGALFAYLPKERRSVGAVLGVAGMTVLLLGASAALLV